MASISYDGAAFMHNPPSSALHSKYQDLSSLRIFRNEFDMAPTYPKTHLLGLPLELRLMIYAQVQTKVEMANPGSNGSVRLLRGPNTALLRTCGQIHDEYKDLAFENADIKYVPPTSMSMPKDIVPRNSSGSGIGRDQLALRDASSDVYKPGIPWEKILTAAKTVHVELAFDGLYDAMSPVDRRYLELYERAGVTSKFLARMISWHILRSVPLQFDICRTSLRVDFYLDGSPGPVFHNSQILRDTVLYDWYLDSTPFRELLLESNAPFARNGNLSFGFIFFMPLCTRVVTTVRQDGRKHVERKDSWADNTLCKWRLVPARKGTTEDETMFGFEVEFLGIESPTQ